MIAGADGPWVVEGVRAICGDGVAAAARLQRIEGPAHVADDSATWILHGVRSNERYVERAEKTRLGAVQEGLDRPHSLCAALIPIRKSDAWWDLPQDERRALFETRSRHIAIGADYLPAIARRLYHCRDLGGWFEFKEADTPAFEDLLARLRATEEWRYVDREVELRLRRR